MVDPVKPLFNRMFSSPTWGVFPCTPIIVAFAVGTAAARTNAETELKIYVFLFINVSLFGLGYEKVSTFGTKSVTV